MANRPAHNIRVSKRQLVFIACAGTCSTSAMTLLYIAYMIGSVVIVAPFANIAPLFTLMITRIFFVREEVFSFNAISGTLLIVAGVILLNVMK